MTRPRRRRTADAARREILEAAERRLAQSGPMGLRLQDVAADVGISHPAVLHHFGSREGLVHAVIERAIVGLQEDLVRSLSETQQGDAPDTAALFEHVFETLFDRGHARLMAWLLLSGYDPFNETARANWAQIGQVTHALRLERVKGKAKADLRGHALRHRPAGARPLRPGDRRRGHVPGGRASTATRAPPAASASGSPRSSRPTWTPEATKRNRRGEESRQAAKPPGEERGDDRKGGRSEDAMRSLETSSTERRRGSGRDCVVRSVARRVCRRSEIPKALFALPVPPAPFSSPGGFAAWRLSPLRGP